MIHGLRADTPEIFPETPAALYASDFRMKDQVREGIPQFLVDLIERGLGMVEADDGAGGEARDLAAQFASNRASCPGYQHHAAGDACSNCVFFQFDRRTSQQIFQAHFANLFDQNFVFDQIEERGHALGLYPRALAFFEHQRHLTA